MQTRPLLTIAHHIACSLGVMVTAGCSHGGGSPAVPTPSNVVVGAPTLSTQVVSLTRGMANATFGRSIETGDVDGDGDPDVHNAKLTTVISNKFAFGGINTNLVFRRV